VQDDQPVVAEILAEAEHCRHAGVEDGHFANSCW
jgi:hypothetical protein